MGLEECLVGVDHEVINLLAVGREVYFVLRLCSSLNS